MALMEIAVRNVFKMEEGQTPKQQKEECKEG
jgi:hypothetical protein